MATKEMTKPTNETPTVQAPTPARAPTSTEDTDDVLMGTDQRKATLDRMLQLKGAHGWRIETRSDFQASVAKAKHHSHALSIFGGLTRRIITVDEYGNIIDNKL